MQVSVDWLKQYAPVKASAHEIAERLTMTVNEVDEVRSVTGLKDIVVAEITWLERHPDADNLWLTDAEAGGKKYRIVTGADNLSVGAKVPLAAPGTVLPDGLKIAKRKLRGIVSEGMLCSARELGAGEDHMGIWLLPADAVPGKSLAAALGGRVDSFDLDVPANRSDLMGHLGIAREVAAAFDASLKEPALKVPNRRRKGVFTPKIVEHGSRFSLARIRGLKNGQTPEWIKDRLASVGVRSINAVVDITNFVMLETGQPLHAYDFSTLTGVMIYVRGAKQDEAIKTLDGKTRKLPVGTPVIADRNQVLGVAGIMGGANSEVSKRTDDIVLECATFDPAAIRRASRQLGLRTDASARFEKGLPAELTWPSIRRAIDLILEICGGELVELTDTYPKKQKLGTVPLTAERLQGFLGESVALPAAQKSLERLGFSAKRSGKKLTLMPPYWRPDVTDEADVIEEVARTIGYDKLPSALPAAQLEVPTRPPLAALRKRVRDSLAGVGLTEILTHSLVGDELLKKSGYSNDLARMANPLSADHAYLRGNLRARHLETVADNLRWRNQLELFELGTVFSKAAPGKRPPEKLKLLVTLAGKGDKSQFESARGILSALLASLHIDPDTLSFETAERESYAPGQHFTFSVGRSRLGCIGEYRNPRQFKAGSIAMLSISLESLAKIVPEDWAVTQSQQFPSVGRDLSLFVPDDVTYSEVRNTVSAAAGPLLRAFGEPEEFRKQGKRSLTVKLLFGADRTLTDKQVNGAMTVVEAAVKKHGWKIRQ